MVAMNGQPSSPDALQGLRAAGALEQVTALADRLPGRNV